MSDTVEEGFVDLDVLGLGGLGDEDVGEDHGNGQKDDDDNHALLQPALGFAHPSNALIFFFLGAPGGAIMMMVMSHSFYFFFSFKDNFSITQPS